jgi:spore coat protein CotH
MHFRLLFLLIVLGASPLPLQAAGKPPTKSSQVFGLEKVWTMHLTVQPKDWETMQPTRGAFSKGNAKAAPLTEERKLRGGFRYDFEYIKGDLEIDGVVLKDVGIRFKGNSSYMLTSNHLKRPFKIDLDRYTEEQEWGGLQKLTLNNNVMDATYAREAMAYGVYRAAGLPAPRTAYAQVLLTVPGKYDKVVVGVYTLIETVDKVFLKERFGSSKGMLLKPEGVGPLDYLGENWSAYEARYRPKTTPTPKMQRRLIDFTSMVQQADETRFRKEIHSYLDVDRFLRYTAATVALSSMDSFVGFGHNYFLYLDAKSDQFTILPWDVDHSFGALLMVGSADDLINLSIRKPSFGKNSLIEKLFADEKVFATYKKYLAELVEKSFTTERIKSDLAAITKTLAPYREEEKKALASRNENWNGWLILGMFNRPPEPEAFTTKRIVSLNAQLAGKSEGKLLRPGGFGRQRGGERVLVKPILTGADNDKDGKLSRDEVIEGVKALFKLSAIEGADAIDQRELTVGLEKVLPKPPGQQDIAFGPPPMAVALARAIYTRAGKEGKVTLTNLVRETETLFDQCDKDKSGKLEQSELSQALRELFNPPKPADKTKKGA